MRFTCCSYTLACLGLIESFRLQPVFNSRQAPIDIPMSTTILAPVSTRSCSLWRIRSTADDDDDGVEGDDEDVEPGKMRVSEIKAELDMRGVAYDDCFDKESLQQRLLEARQSGIANPELIDKFNKQRLEDTFEGRKPVDEALSDDELLKNAVGSDGNLPGGLSPEQFKGLIENPEVMVLLQSPKMQDAMKLVMSGGQEELAKAVENDPELRDIVMKLSGILGGGDQ